MIRFFSRRRVPGPQRGRLRRLHPVEEDDFVVSVAASEPQRFGKYQIIERIASGGMAEIFKARLDGIGGFHRTFAIKRILPHLTANSEFVDMLVDEAKVAGLLSHANIVQILDLGAVDDQYYIAMEYVNGRDLGKILARCREKNITLPVPHAVYVLLEMLKGLEYAHHRTVMRNGKPVPLNIVHRDISPANVLVSFQGEVKLTDFGIAKASVKALETMSGVIKGRFDYMSPEQAAGGEVDQRSDLFSAGVVFYELLTGSHPFRQPNEAATIEAIRRGGVAPPSSANPDVPPIVDEVVGRALQVDPSERFADATQFKEALDRFFHDAGFIFSASTLATFIRGLFPEHESRGPADTRPPSPPRPRGDLPVARPDNLELQDDLRPRLAPRGAKGGGGKGASVGPPAESGLKDLRTLLASLPAAPATGGESAGTGDESTVIRPNPMSNPDAWNEASTVIRPDLVAEPAGPPPPGTAPVRTNEPTAILEPTRVQEPPGRANEPPTARAGAGGAEAAPPLRTPTLEPVHPEAEPNRAPPLKSSRPAPASGAPAPSVPVVAPAPELEPSTPGWVHVAWVFVALLTLALGVVVGVMVSGLRPAPAVVAARVEPMVEVHFPTGARVSVAGKPLPGPSPARTAVPVGQAVVVRVEGDGYAAESSLTLDWNQVRVLFFSPVEPQKPSP